MSTYELIKEIQKLPDKELQLFLTKILSHTKIVQEIERLGYLKLTESAFEFWNDPQEDIYQDYTRSTLEGK